MSILLKIPKTKKKAILQHQIIRLAKIYTSRKVSVENLAWHNRVSRLQVKCILAKQLL